MIFDWNEPSSLIVLNAQTAVLFSILLFILIISVLTGSASMAFYALGEKGSEAVLAEHPKLAQGRWDPVQGWFDRYGTAVLLLTAVPALSAVIIMCAGTVGLRKWMVLVAAINGRFVRYLAILLLLYGVLRLF